MNAGINPIAALTRLRNGYLATMPILSAAMTALTAEAAAVARTEGFDISDREAGDLAVKVARRTRDNRASMLQDVEKGRRTEIDYLNGYVAEQGRRLGVKTPFNDAVVQAVHRHGVGTLRPDPENLEPLVKMLPG